MQGIVGAFQELDSVVMAADELKRANLGEITMFTPTPRHEIEEVMDRGPSKVRVFTLVFGLAGVSFGYWIPIWISDYWPLVVGGKPVASWVPYTILGFEVMVLVGALATVFAMFGLSRVPRLTQTVGYQPSFSGGDYGIWVATTPENADAVQAIMQKHGAREVRRER